MNVYDRTDYSRPDGRPEAYEPPGSVTASPCTLCVLEGKTGLRYGRGELFMSSPADSSDGRPHLVCRGHLPKNIVIFDPQTGKCRNRDGSHVWEEPEPGMQVPYIPPKDVGVHD